MLQIQLYTNRFPEELNQAIGSDRDGAGFAVSWVSPTADDRYREYQDETFLNRLGLTLYTEELAKFWPRGGPCWDALGLWMDTNAAGQILIEAKSYPEEAFSTLAARSSRSRGMIYESLERTASWLGLPSIPPTWTAGRYQTANRLAHLMFLRQVCGLNALLVFVCITMDPTHIRTGEHAWRVANEKLWDDMQLDGPPPHTSVVFVPGRNRSGEG
jgi:hypothetical protein